MVSSSLVGHAWDKVFLLLCLFYHKYFMKLYNYNTYTGEDNIWYRPPPSLTPRFIMRSCMIHEG